jgi:hypothetical protein
VDRRNFRPWLVAAAAVFAAVFAFVAIGVDSERGGQGRSVIDERAAPTSLETDAAARRRSVPDVELARREREPPPHIENLVWGEIDLREAQAAMPDNLYWEFGAPTDDPEILEMREREKKRRNEEYGRVLSGDADEAGVNAYYDYRERLSADYLEFAQWMRKRYGDSLSEQFGGLLDLAIKLNAERLIEIGRDRERALERSRERARVREDWRRQQEEFGEFAGR